MQIFKNPDYNFIRWRWHAIVLSVIVILAGIGTIWTKGMPLGIDFKGGTLLIVKFAAPVTEDQHGPPSTACRGRRSCRNAARKTPTRF